MRHCLVDAQGTQLPTRRPAAVGRAEPAGTVRSPSGYEDQVATIFDSAVLDESDVRLVLGAMRARMPQLTQPDPSDVALARDELHRDLNNGKITLETFSRSWRRLERPATQVDPPPDELRLARAHRALSHFGTKWRNPAVPDRLREEAIGEIFERFDVDGPEIVGAHPQPNENAWLLGLVAVREEQLRMQRMMGVVGARGIPATQAIPYPAAKDYGPRDRWPTLAVVWHMAEGRSVAEYLSRDPLRGVSVRYAVEQATDRWKDGEVVHCLPEDRISGSINPRTIRRGDDPDGYFGASHAKAALGSYWPETSPNCLAISVEVAGRAAEGPTEAQPRTSGPPRSPRPTAPTRSPRSASASRPPSCSPSPPATSS